MWCYTRSLSKNLFQWLSDNQIKGKVSGNCHLKMSTDQSVNFQLCSSLIEKGDCEKMLGVKIDCKHNFDKTLYSKANNKMRALTRATQ